MECPICDSEMVEKIGEYGPFFGCSRFPLCKGSRDYKKETGESLVQNFSQSWGGNPDGYIDHEEQLPLTCDDYS